MSPDALNTARQALANKRPAAALEALKRAPEAYQTDADYLRAHAFFSMKNYARAAALFGQLNGSFRYGEAAQWYEILSLLPSFEQSKPLILKKMKTILEDSGHTFQREAIQLANIIYADQGLN